MSGIAQKTQNLKFRFGAILWTFLFVQGIHTPEGPQPFIGEAHSNVLCYVVHPDDGSLCPPRVSGELWIGRVGVSTRTRTM